MCFNKLIFHSFIYFPLNSLIHIPSTIEGTWIKKFTFPYHFSPTPFGICQSFNLFSYEKQFNTETTVQNLTVKNIRDLRNKLSKPSIGIYNSTFEFKTSRKSYGFNGFIYDGFPFMPDNRPNRKNSTYRLIFHPSFELPNERSQQFLIHKEQSFEFLITPVMKTIDESLNGMSPKK